LADEIKKKVKKEEKEMSEIINNYEQETGIKVNVMTNSVVFSREVLAKIKRIRKE